MTEASRLGVFLCQCNGRVSGSLPLDQVRLFLEQKQPGLPVIIADNLCQASVLSGLIREHKISPAVLGGCSQLKSKPGFWEEPEVCSLDPDSIGIVDLVRETAASYKDTELLERAKLLLWAQVKRQAKFSGVPQEARKLRFARPQGEISRRDLFQSLFPRYQVAPYIEALRCVGEKCELCRQSCAFNAVIVDDKGVSIDSLACNGCGACTAVCPHRAIIYPNCSSDQLEAELEGLLSGDSDVLQPRIVAVVCQSSRHSSSDSDINIFKNTPNVLPIEIPCLFMVSPWLMLRAFDLGAQGLALIYNREKCQFKFDSEKWQETVQFVQALLDHWGIQQERVSAFEDKNVEQELPRFGRRMANLAPILLRSSHPTELPVEGMLLPALIRGMGEKLGVASVGVISSGAVPFGKLTLDSSQCTGCGLCAADCPTEALTVLPGSDSYSLTLRQESCVGCGLCIKVCPERCLKLEKILDLGKLGYQSETITEGDFVRCKVCDAPIAPRAMIDKVRARITAAGGVTSQLETCPDCRMRTKPRLSKSGVGV